jgi:hypothetical protein
VAIIDGDRDGRFEPVTFLEKDRIGWPVCDYFAIDLDADGEFQRDMSRRNETQPLGRMVLLQDAYYAIDISGESQELSLRPIDPEKGILLWDRADCELDCRLWSDAADQQMTVPSEQKELTLPAGKYSAARIVVRARDASGETWETKCSQKFGDLPLFEIKAGEATRLEIGPPFTCTSHVTKGDDGVMHIEPVLKGRTGEEYSSIVSQSGQRTPTPAITIVDETGTVLETGKFEYG